MLRANEGMIDASELNTCQVKYMAQNERPMFAKLDFTRCEDNFINDSLGNISMCTIIPLKYRRSVQLVKEFHRLSKESRLALVKKDDDELLSFHAVPVDRRCLYLVRSILRMGTNVVWGMEEEMGYNSLIRSCIYNKGQMLKMN